MRFDVKMIRGMDRNMKNLLKNSYMLICSSVLLFQYSVIFLNNPQYSQLINRNTHLISTVCCVILAVVVGSVGLLLLDSGLFRDLSSFWFCVVIAASQYSLIRSVQPDSASPTHVSVLISSMYMFIYCGPWKLY